MSDTPKIPDHILERKDDSPEEFKKQQARIKEWVSAQKRLNKKEAK
jgi:hypothetical protein